MLMKTSTQSLTEQLSARFGERIRNRLFAPGARLPSVRQCAQQHGVSPSTVVAAYDQLLAQGLVEARKNRGFFVREMAPALTAERMPDGAAADADDRPVGNWSTAHWFATRGAGRGAPPVNATALIRGMFHKISDKPQPGMGVFPPEWLESTFMPAAVRKVTHTRALQDFSLQYGEPLGDTGLRRVLSKKLATLNVHAAPENIITTVGATHALDIVSRTLLRPGDPVMVEEPGWAVEFARLSALGMHILPVPRRADGPDLEVMAKYCEVHQPKLYVSVSVFHNPTGYCLTPGSAHRILQLANQHNFHVVEDDTYSHIAPEHATRLTALDGLQRTIYVSGFAKILAPNWRIGFLAAPAALTEQLLDTKLLATLTTPALLEKALALCIEQGQLRRHSERIRTRLDAARARSVKLALGAGCTFAAEPVGLFGWVDTGVDTDALSQRMLDEGYLLAPGALFHAERKPSTLMRINFATTQDATFWRVFQRVRAEQGR
ncbi:MAG: PLP-dependent aminotransferase family protein [Gammaproteobacteria bacterium]|nr:PLP-dependent aminotransferase family protein [Gammaproteobacteria bacterium]MBU1506736.1 PLP-dependent aminotransferase family protein [Gammaproteobacteria bacterium]MBU2120616.1 PLP-dependent aminotransferase family protein [Gammaproteobacteria bacterium]MBU2169000.1 PLP-dependent aminotransferase family protein [Gammaproteobacteria bacterium]MBU2201093.1 PLP-dependent aminotransferase family protein [Gammaproteobacteria bacterium]